MNKGACLGTISIARNDFDSSELQLPRITIAPKLTSPTAPLALLGRGGSYIAWGCSPLDCGGGVPPLHCCGVGACTAGGGRPCTAGGGCPLTLREVPPIDCAGCPPRLRGVPPETARGAPLDCAGCPPRLRGVPPLDCAGCLPRLRGVLP